MSRLVVAVVAGALVFAASPAIALAQNLKPVQADQAKELQAELEKLRARQAEIEARLRQIIAETELRRAEEVLGQKDKIIQLELEKALKLANDQEKLQYGRSVQLAQIEFEKALKVKEGQDKPKVVVLEAGGKQGVPFEKMSPEELKQVIAKLQILLEEKTRNADKTKTIEKVKPGSTEKVKPGGVSNDEIMKRLDILTMQVEELRRAIKK